MLIREVIDGRSNSCGISLMETQRISARVKSPSEVNTDSFFPQKFGDMVVSIPLDLTRSNCAMWNSF